MIIKSKAPFRIGLAGGGSDVNPYTERYGGEVVNATIGLFARTAIETSEDGMVYIDFNGLPSVECELSDHLPLLNTSTDLAIAVYNRFARDHGVCWKGLAVNVHAEVPVGSGLGTSSTIVVSLCGAFLELYGLKWEPDRIAEYAYSIEREDLHWAGGKQDQYAAVYGGINHLVFERNGRVEVEPLQVNDEFISLLEQTMFLYYTNQKRHSSTIIREQQQHVMQGDAKPLDAMHHVRMLAASMRDAVLANDLAAMARILDEGFLYKRKMAEGISYPLLEEIYEAAKQAGATGGKISGAGGGGFVVFFVDPSKRAAVTQALVNFGGQEFPFHFTGKGLTTWRE